MNEYPRDAVPVLRLTVAVPGLRDLYLASSPHPEALAWDAARDRARSVARTVEREVGTHPDVRTVRADGDTVHVLLRLEPPFARWPGWCAYFGITAAAECTAPHILAGEGSRDGVRVTAAVQPLPAGPDDTREQTEEQDVADPEGLTRPFQLGGTAYDLTLPYRDAHGETWYFQGRRAYDGMPLMSLDGRPERCSLAHVAEYAGPLTPLTPVTEPEAPAEPAPDEGDR
ncbi:BN159_2729 family protein [Streptomyces lusitanus]|uniref:BN159_2729 family protein n=1 Tax=Streptomyces lusitanus TaxID=68232 RepID=A0ABU3K0T3_9ACTN|nr:BN159_2729 family protein [Streptomyces lusitanus]